MGTKHTSTCLIKAADAEPIFVLRATDPLAATVVRFWARQAADNGVKSAKVAEAFEQARIMEAYGAAQGTKLPD